MNVSAYNNGNKIYWDEKLKIWKHTDGSGINKIKVCPKCNKLPNKDGSDACLNKLPGVKNACCGHGVSDGYIQFTNNTMIRFNLKDINHGSTLRK